jgi:hypothetical protein
MPPRHPSALDVHRQIAGLAVPLQGAQIAAHGRCQGTDRKLGAIAEGGQDGFGDQLGRRHTGCSTPSGAGQRAMKRSMSVFSAKPNQVQPWTVAQPCIQRPGLPCSGKDC